MTVIVTSKVIATRVKNIVAKRLDRNNLASESKHNRSRSHDPDFDSRKMNGNRVRKKKKIRHHSRSRSPLTSSLSSSSSSSLSPSISSDNVQRKPFRRKQLIESSEYDDSDEINSDEDSIERTVYNINKKGKLKSIFNFLQNSSFYCPIKRLNISSKLYNDYKGFKKW